MLIRRTERQTRRGNLAATVGNQAAGGLDRRSFLRKSGLVASGLATIGALPLASVQKAEAAGPNVAGATIRKSICTHCSVGCTVTAEVSNGVWVGQEPSWDSPINRGSHCAKGASVRELVSGERRLKYPMKLTNGQWTRVSWDVAINEIGDQLTAIRQKEDAQGRDHLRRRENVDERTPIPGPSKGRIRVTAPQVKRDPAFGPVVMFGFGGIFVEIFRDVSFRIAPIPVEHVQAMMREVRAFPMLTGARGRPHRDTAALEECLQRLSQLAVECPQIQELDINPLIVRNRGSGCAVADARILVARP